MNRRALALALLAVVTAFMWSDTVVSWWQSTIEFFMNMNEHVTQTVLDSRPGNDADLHVIVWAGTGAVFVWAFRSAWRTTLAALLAWSAVVETLQPVFTEIRARQLADYLGNALGIGVVALVTLVVSRLGRVDQPNSPAR